MVEGAGARLLGERGVFFLLGLVYGGEATGGPCEWTVLRGAHSRSQLGHDAHMAEKYHGCYCLHHLA